MVVARKRATLGWLVARLSTSSKIKKRNTSWDNSAVVFFFPARAATMSPSSTSLSFSLFPVSIGTLLLAPPQLPRTSTVCINEHAPPPASYYPHPSIGCNGYPCSFHNPSCSRPALFHTPFSLRCFLTCPFLQCVQHTYICAFFFFFFLFFFFSFLFSRPLLTVALLDDEGWTRIFGVYLHL